MMARRLFVSLLPLAACLLAACSTLGGGEQGGEQAASPQAITVPDITHPQEETPAWWYRAGAAQAAERGAMAGRAKNVIVFLGDGMSLPTVAAARILEGQRAGASGEEHRLAWEDFPATAFSRTYNTDSQTPDSAGTMTAVATGVKTHIGAIGVSAGNRDDCAGSRGKALRSWLDLAADAGLATGIVTTTRLTHATPAATYAHVPNRNWESDADLPDTARAAGCTDIAGQFVRMYRRGHGPQVVLAGGARQFLPDEKVAPGLRGVRKDGRNLIAEWQAAVPGGVFVHDRAQLQAATGAPAVLGLFAASHMDYDHDRDRGPHGQPDLETMTRFAIRQLQRDGDGFVLLVEGGRIDHAHHEGNAYRALDETLAMARAVRAATEMTSADDTLIVVTADHAHTLNFVGYPVRGNPILGKVRGRSRFDGAPGELARDLNGQPYTTLLYASGPGYTGASDRQPVGPKHHPHAPKKVEQVATGRPDLSAVDTADPDYLQEALLPMGSETHGGDDVGIWARGPGSAAFRGSLEQNAIYHVIVQATPKLRAALCAQGLCNADGVPVTLPAIDESKRRAD